MVKFFQKFGKHYAIERFGVIFLTLTILLSVVVGSITTKKVQAEHRTLSGNAIYTRNFSFSQTRTTGKLVSLHVNKDHSKVFLLLKIDDMSLMPNNAENYQMFLSAVNPDRRYEEIKSYPSGAIYLYGSSGYIGVLLEDAAGFPNQLLNLYIRADNFTGMTASGYADGTFNDYNQCRIYFNPGGSYANVAAYLDKPDWTPADMVEETMTRSAEVNLRDVLRSDLLQMVQQQLYIEEYRRRLTEDYDVVVPELPEAIAGDNIYGIDITGKVDGKLHYITSYGGGWVNEDGSAGVRMKDALVYFESPYVVKDGFNFNWQDGRILTGYLESLTGSTDINRWLTYVSGGSAGGLAIDWSNVVWKTKDGVEISTTSSFSQATTQREKDIISTIQLYQNAVDSYYALKVKYQTEDLRSLLSLEIDAKTMLVGYTVNTGSKKTVLTIW